ncbi:MAG TPA: DUF1697 domain-containing protein, partial [Gemmatimonadaceae bacterium]|nr:DUF1697 domain-containing protein [Gemmatimonadaceae bacterium]
MTRHFAFLRAINVGGHVVKMDHLRRLFEKAGFTGVETFIASGNVIFESRARDTRALERTIEKVLREALGYEVATFVRTQEELEAVAAHEPFQAADVEAARSLNIAFLAGPLDGDGERRVMALRSEIDDFHVRGRELFWLCRGFQRDSSFSNNAFERAVGVSSTFRGVNTV